MPGIKLLNIFAISTLAILLCSFAPSQTLAVSIGANHLARQVPNHHDLSKKKKRGNKRCKPRPSSSSPQPTSTKDSNPPKTDDPKNDISPSSTTPPNNVPTQPAYTGSGKLGLAWGLSDEDLSLFAPYKKRIAIIHVWSGVLSDGLRNSGFATSAMLWGNRPSDISDFVKYVKPGYATEVYGFNEPNEPTQANLVVAKGVELWRQYLQPLGKQGVTLGSPATTSAPDGFTWMTDFIKQCPDCHMDRMNLHFYDTTFEKLQTYVEKWQGFNLPMRLTEFACVNFNNDGKPQPNMGEILDFTYKAISYLENNDKILSYAPFGLFHGAPPGGVPQDDSLISGKTFSNLGWAYVNNGH